MDMVSMEIQTAAISAAAALAIGGSVSLLGARNVAGLARFAAGLVIRRRMMMMLGMSALTGLGVFGAAGMGGDGFNLNGVLAMLGDNFG